MLKRGLTMIGSMWLLTGTMGAVSYLIGKMELNDQFLVYLGISGTIAFMLYPKIDQFWNGKEPVEEESNMQVKEVVREARVTKIAMSQEDIVTAIHAYLESKGLEVEYDEVFEGFDSYLDETEKADFSEDTLMIITPEAIDEPVPTWRHI